MQKSAMQKPSIWSKLMFVESILLVIMGLMFAFIPLLVPDFSKILFNIYYGLELGVKNKELNFISFLTGISGAVLIGWGVMTIFLSYFLIKKEESVYIWNSILVSILFWFSFDSLISFLNGAILNIVGNVLVLVFYLIPILGKKLQD